MKTIVIGFVESSDLGARVWAGRGLVACEQLRRQHVAQLWVARATPTPTVAARRTRTGRAAATPTRTAAARRARIRAGRHGAHQYRTAAARRRAIRAGRHPHQRLRRQHVGAYGQGATTTPTPTARTTRTAPLRHDGLPPRLLRRRYYPAYHPPTTVNVYGSACSNCGGWSTAGAAAAGAAVGVVAGAAIASANTNAATSNAYSAGYAAGATNTAYAMGAIYPTLACRLRHTQRRRHDLLPVRQHVVPAVLRRERRLLSRRADSVLTQAEEIEMRNLEIRNKFE